MIAPWLSGHHRNHYLGMGIGQLMQRGHAMQGKVPSRVIEVWEWLFASSLYMGTMSDLFGAVHIDDMAVNIDNLSEFEQLIDVCTHTRLHIGDGKRKTPFLVVSSEYRLPMEIIEPDGTDRNAFINSLGIDIQDVEELQKEQFVVAIKPSLPLAIRSSLIAKNPIPADWKIDYFSDNGYRSTN